MYGWPLYVAGAELTPQSRFVWTALPSAWDEPTSQPVVPTGVPGSLGSFQSTAQPTHRSSQGGVWVTQFHAPESVTVWLLTATLTEAGFAALARTVATNPKVSVNTATSVASRLLILVDIVRSSLPGMQLVPLGSGSGPGYPVRQ